MKIAPSQSLAVPTSTTPSAARLSRRPRGQGMTEYIIIVALIAIASIGVITVFGDNIRALFGMAIDGLAGETSVEKRTKSSKGDALEKKKLSNFGKENDGYG